MLAFQVEVELRSQHHGRFDKVFAVESALKDAAAKQLVSACEVKRVQNLSRCEVCGEMKQARNLDCMGICDRARK